MMWSHRISRRQFLLSSAATTVAGLACEPLHSVLAAPSLRDEGQLTFVATGDATHGYGVDVLFQGQPIARRNRGEFSAAFQNSDRSLQDLVENWRGSSWDGNQRHLVLHGRCKLANLNTTVFVEVEYELVTTHVARKQIRFRQADSYVLFYQVTNPLEALSPPARLWSFDQLDCHPGVLHEYFPAAGFRTQAGVTVGLLTDAGYRNHWSRIIRRDGKPVKPAT